MLPFFVRMKALLEENQSSLFSRTRFFPNFWTHFFRPVCNDKTGLIFIPILPHCVIKFQFRLLQPSILIFYSIFMKTVSGWWLVNSFRVEICYQYDLNIFFEVILQRWRRRGGRARRWGAHESLSISGGPTPPIAARERSRLLLVLMIFVVCLGVVCFG